MKEANIVIVDSDADYCRRLDGCLRARLSFPVAVHDYTDPLQLQFHDRRQDTAVLLISEQALTSVSLAGFPRVIILTEGLGTDAEQLAQAEGSGSAAGEPVIRLVNKYRAMSGLLREVTALVSELAGSFDFTRTARGKRAELIGFFTPITRCLQTTCALTLGQLYARERKTLFIDLESFAGLPGPFANATGGENLTELLYYFDCEPKKLAVHLERIRMQIGALHVIPPADGCAALLETEPQVWREVLSALARETDYEVIVADLSVCVRGLFDLLGDFDRIVTIERGDPISAEKLSRFERMLRRGGFEELTVKTTRLTLPVFDRLPADPARLGDTELASYLWKFMQEKGASHVDEGFA